MKVFTLEYVPFVMGGSVWQPMACEVEADGPHDIGHGFEGYIVTAPNGKTFIAEAISGAFVGPDLETVRNDIRIGEKETMQKQVYDALAMSEKARMAEPDEFWRKLKCNKKRK